MSDITEFPIETVNLSDVPLDEFPEVGKLPSSVIVGEKTWSLYIKGDTNPENVNYNEMVNFGWFWDAQSDLPRSQWYEIFAKFESGQYFADDNNGGTHAGILFGIDSNGILSGNTSIKRDSDSVIIKPAYGSGVPVRFDDLTVISRLHLENKIIVFNKGVPIGVKEFEVGTRRFEVTNANAQLTLGGYDHQGATLYAVYMRIMEGSEPFIAGAAGLIYPPVKSLAAKFTPDKNNNTLSADYSGGWDFTNPYNVSTIPDQSRGQEVVPSSGIFKQHPGNLTDSVPNKFANQADADVSGSRGSYKQIALEEAPFTEAIPASAGAFVSDSFTRKDSTYLWSKTISAGSVEVGGQAWQCPANSCGIMSKHLYFKLLYNMYWLTAPIEDYRVEFTRANSVNLRPSTHYETYNFKGIDNANFLGVKFDPFGFMRVYDFTSVYGGTQIGANIAVTMAWTKLSARFVGNTCQVYLDATLVDTFTAPARFDNQRRFGYVPSDPWTFLKKVEILPS